MLLMRWRRTRCAPQRAATPFGPPGAGVRPRPPPPRGTNTAALPPGPPGPWKTTGPPNPPGPPPPWSPNPAGAPGTASPWPGPPYIATERSGAAPRATVPDITKASDVEDCPRAP